MKDSLPADVERFLADHIDSVEAVNVLLLLFEQPARSWTADEVGRESRTNEYSADLNLRELNGRGLLRLSPGSPPTYRADPAFAQVVSSLARTFRERRVAVITFIYSRPDDLAGG
ncbi:MAG TPA: hypothetical protein VF334_11605 [Polyangia bacterium]